MPRRPPNISISDLMCLVWTTAIIRMWQWMYRKTWWNRTARSRISARSRCWNRMLTPGKWRCRSLRPTATAACCIMHTATTTGSAFPNCSDGRTGRLTHSVLQCRCRLILCPALWSTVITATTCSRPAMWFPCRPWTIRRRRRLPPRGLRIRSLRVFQRV